jgi:hypothetical protein
MQMGKMRNTYKLFVKAPDVGEGTVGGIVVTITRKP